MDLEARKKVARHKKQSYHYFENARRYIGSRDAEKASEFLWGSMTQALKAVALSKDRLLTRHGDIERYAREFRKSEDKDIYDAFSKARFLHSNFYETGLSLDEVVTGADEIGKAVTKLLSHVPDGN